MKADPTRRLYLVVNDIVGGFDLSHHDKPMSEHDIGSGEWSVAWGVTPEFGERVCHLWNRGAEVCD